MSEKLPPLPDNMKELVMTMESSKATWHDRARAATLIGCYVMQMEESLSKFDQEFQEMRKEFVTSMTTHAET